MKARGTRVNSGLVVARYIRWNRNTRLKGVMLPSQSMLYVLRVRVRRRIRTTMVEVYIATELFVWFRVGSGMIWSRTSRELSLSPTDYDYIVEVELNQGRLAGVIAS